jgi:hypothetical protein
MNAPSAPTRVTKSSAWLLGLILCLGVAVRLYPSAGYKDTGFDEHMYATYTGAGADVGLTGYGRVVEQYLTSQARAHDAVVPATRIGFIWPSVLIQQTSGCTPLRALHVLSTTAAILLLLITPVIGYRLVPTTQMLVTTALIASAPLQVFLGQRALIDEYFAFWTILSAWFFFESLGKESSRWWVVAFGFSLFVLILTKENAAFVAAALLATWLCFIATRLIPPKNSVLIATAAAGALAVAILCFYLGGVAQWISFYRSYGAKSAGIRYVILFQDGAWYRYLVDFVVLSPAIVALGFGRIFNLNRDSVADLFWAVFLGFSFIFMSSVPLGMSLRFAAYWDEPLRWLAASQLVAFAGRFPLRWRTVTLAAGMVVLVGLDAAQYNRFFIKAEIYDPVSAHLLRASKLVK